MHAVDTASEPWRYETAINIVHSSFGLGANRWLGKEQNLNCVYDHFWRCGGIEMVAHHQTLLHNHTALHKLSANISYIWRHTRSNYEFLK